jgi:hypothetical protein
MLFEAMMDFYQGEAAKHLDLRNQPKVKPYLLPPF